MFDMPGGEVLYGLKYYGDREERSECVRYTVDLVENVRSRRRGSDVQRGSRGKILSKQLAVTGRVTDSRELGTTL